MFLSSWFRARLKQRLAKSRESCACSVLGFRGAVGPTLPRSPGDRARPEVRRAPAPARTSCDTDIEVGPIFREEQPTVSGDAVLLKKTARAAP